MKMKRIFRRNQIIITTLAIMIAAAGYLNYSGQEEVGPVYEAGVMEISDEDILAENKAAQSGEQDSVNVDSGEAKEYQEIASLDNEPDAEAADAGNAEAAGAQAEVQDAEAQAEAAGAGAADAGETGTEAGSSEADSGSGIDNPGEAVLTGGTSVTDYIANVQLNREQIRAKNKETLMEIINNENVDSVSKETAVQDMIDMTAIAEKENAAETLLMAKGFADPVVSITDGKVDVVINAITLTDPERAQIEDIVKRKTEVTADNIVITLMQLQE